MRSGKLWRSLFICFPLDYSSYSFRNCFESLKLWSSSTVGFVWSSKTLPAFLVSGMFKPSIYSSWSWFRLLFILCSFAPVECWWFTVVNPSPEHCSFLYSAGHGVWRCFELVIVVYMKFRCCLYVYLYVLRSGATVDRCHADEYSWSSLKNDEFLEKWWTTRRGQSSSFLSS
jgi:hypothetical protein